MALIVCLYLATYRKVRQLPIFHDKNPRIRGNSRNLITPVNYKKILFIRAVFSAKSVFSTRGGPAGVESGFFIQ
ncbi:hypothetical protein D8L93_04320 [Sodalis-like symbiont of Bactericera trigonica]|nr:hypothetical protein D8L93_04320 [Sodalis-like symbiont of Bactericera trigonica]